MKVGIAILSLCIVVAQLAPLAIIPYAAGRKADSVTSTSSTYTNAKSDDSSSTGAYYTKDGNRKSGTNEDTRIPTPNASIELVGYGSIGYSTQAFTIDMDGTTDTVKHLTYKDNKTRLEIGFVTGLSDKTDIPGYIVRKIAKVDTVTNDKETITVDNANYIEKEGDTKNNSKYYWMKVKADKEIDGQIVYVYYLLSENKDSAMYIRINADKELEQSKFLSLISTMLNTPKIYYSGSTVFDTPNGGYYENNKPNDNKGTGQGNYKENTEDNKIYVGKEGFIKADDMPKNWDSLTIKIGDDKLSIPAVLSEYISKGYKIDTIMNSKSAKDKLGYGLKLTDLTLTKGNISIDVDIMNNVKGEDKPLSDCRVVAVRLNQKNFKYIADIPREYIVLPGGITLYAYTNDILDYYGPVTYNESETGSGDSIRVKKYTWVKGEKSMQLTTGIVANITAVEFKIADALEAE